MENNKGFSLVELIIVVAIMAVLMGILAPQYIRYVEKTRIRADDSIISEVDKSCQATLALEKFYTDTSGTVTVIVADDGTVSASGFNTATISAAFEAEVNTSVYGQPSSVNKFKSHLLKTPNPPVSPMPT